MKPNGTIIQARIVTHEYQCQGLKEAQKEPNHCQIDYQSFSHTLIIMLCHEWKQHAALEGGLGSS